MATPKHAQESIRLFNSDFIERLSHIHPLAPILTWAPIMAILGYFIAPHLHFHTFIISYILGLVIWTPAEYVIHRFAFHFPAKSDFGKRVVHLMHGIHHDAPNDLTRLLMHPVPGLLYGAIILGIMMLFSPWYIASSVFVGFITGYLIYDYIHYSVHYFSFNNKIFRILRSHHMAHHFKDHDKNYGVSSKLWDKIFHSTIK